MKEDELKILKEIIYKLGEHHDYPITAKLLLRFFEKIEAISSIVTKFDKRTDVYPCMILIRSQIEHLMVIYYIWMKNRITKSDKVSNDYVEAYRTSEFLKQENYKLSLQKLTDTSCSVSLLDKLKSSDKRIEGLTNTMINDIHVCASQFDIRNIAKFIINEVDNSDKFALKDKMIKFLKVYNWASSFTHGGPMAEMLFFDDLEVKNFSKKLDEYKSWSERIILALIILIFWFYGKFDDKLESQIRNI